MAGGFFDRTAVPQGWFDGNGQAAGWFDTGGLSAASGSGNATASFTGAWSIRNGATNTFSAAWSVRNAASATFAGTKHMVALAFTGMDGVDSAEALIEALPDHEFRIPGQVVADALVVSIDQAALPQPRMVLELELLLLEDG